MTDTADRNQEARIHDRGYRRYDGPRTGTRGATLSLLRYTLARILGLRRPAAAKVLPTLTIALAYLPGIAFVGIGVFIPKRFARDAFPGYSEYYGFIVSAILLFVAFVAPEAVCPDRRHRVLGVYLTSPLDRRTYVLAKYAALVLAISSVTLLPPLVLAVARSLQGFGPAPSDLALLLVRIIGSGAMLSMFYAAFALGVSSMTDRKGWASAGVVIAVIVSSVASSIVTGHGERDWPVVFNLAALPYELVQRVYGQPGDLTGVRTVAMAGAALAWMALAATVVWLRYRSLEVTR